LIAAGLLYIAGLSTCATYWLWAVRDQGARPGIAATFAAYFAGHLGKYSPGKGLVVVIRAGLLRDSGVHFVVGAISCAHETLLMMATGALIATIFSSILFNRTILACSLLTFLCLGVAALPPLVSHWSRWVARPFAAATEGLRYDCRWPTVLRGAVVTCVGWFFTGLSLAAVLASMRSWDLLAEQIGVVRAIALVTAVVALATVGGFLSFLPGGLGSREWILVETLGPALGPGRMADAAVAAILLRLVWIIAELVSWISFWLLDRQCKKRRGVTSS
jgi:uncharacterized membrane protein YbhN (UPF0104 family)